MSWSAPRTWATSDTITAALLNQEIRDNLSFLHDPPTCRIYHSVDQSIGNSSDQAVVCNSERYDTDTMHSTSSNTSRITFTTAGKYRVWVVGMFAANATGIRRVRLRLNGGSTYIAQNNEVSLSGTETHIVAYTEYAFAAADYVEVMAFQNSTGSLNWLASGSANGNEIGASWFSG